MVDTTVQPKAIAHPTDARLVHRAIEKLTELERLTGVETRRIHVDKGYRGHNHTEKFRVWITGQVRRVTAQSAAR